MLLGGIIVTKSPASGTWLVSEFRAAFLTSRTASSWARIISPGACYVFNPALCVKLDEVILSIGFRGGLYYVSG